MTICFTAWLGFFQATEDHAAFVPLGLLKVDDIKNQNDFNQNGLERPEFNTACNEKSENFLGAIGAPVPETKNLSEVEIEEEFFESDDDLEEKLSVNVTKMEKRMNLLMQKQSNEKNGIKSNFEQNEGSESISSTSSPGVSPPPVETDFDGIPIKQSSDQWSKVAEKLKKAPSKVQESLIPEKSVIGELIFGCIPKKINYSILINKFNFPETFCSV